MKWVPSIIRVAGSEKANMIAKKGITDGKVLYFKADYSGFLTNLLKRKEYFNKISLV